MTCNQCDSEMKVQNTGPLQGRQDDIQITIQNLPCWVCPQGCPDKLLADDDFRNSVDSLLEDLPYARTTGLFRRVTVCCQCKAPLKNAARKTSQIQKPIRFESKREAMLVIQAPVLICAACRTEQLGDVEDTVVIGEAVMEALENAHIPV